MSFPTLLYTFLISPLELLFEVIFTIANKIIGNPGISIIALSIAVNFLVLPLYKRADELQAEERDIQAKMAYRIKRTKQTFKGDERFFMLQEYYRINKYKPIYALKSSASLLLQIPFFIAAYRLLSGMQSLQGMSFGSIADLGKEDASFMIGSFPVNILPILMTAINIISGIIYTKGHPLKSKIQVYGLAVVFLVLLYHSPSGLVFYWLLNNVFSLVKNIFYKLKDPKKVLGIVLAAAAVAIFILTVIRPDLTARQKFLLGAGCVLLTMPLVSGLIKKKQDSKKISTSTKDVVVFVSGTVLMALITGLLIPSSVIKDSPLEFIDIVHPYNPAYYIVSSMALALGSWVLWGSVFYFFMSDKMKAVFSKGIWAICGVSVIDYMLFGTNLGTMTSTLQYDVQPVFKLTDYLLNALAVIAIAAVFLFFYKRFHKIARTILVVGIVTVAGIGIFNSSLIADNFKEYTSRSEAASAMPEIPLSKNGKNVIVFMLDRSEGQQIPYILKERPSLKEQFDGFTYYPNTFSFGHSTIIGAPALFGGYEYTPERMNERSDEKLSDKHNEALKVMPVLFGENGYKVTICDPPFAGYQSIPDLSIFNDHPEFNCYITEGRFNYFTDGINDASVEQSSERTKAIRNRNFFCFSLMKISPVIFQETLYDEGLYNEAGNTGDIKALSASSLVQTVGGVSLSSGYQKSFLESYAVLMNLPKITTVEEGSQNTFLMINNHTAHSACILKKPDYTPDIFVDNRPYDTNWDDLYTIDGKKMDMSDPYQVTHYHANISSLIQLGKWFDYMRANGVYDNTRIILVSDHARGLNQFNVYCEGQDMEFYMPLLMFKDFNAKGFTVNEELMSNGDTPFLATSGIIKDPKNPFTGNPINNAHKKGTQYCYYTEDLNPDQNQGNVFSTGRWYALNGDPRKADSWKTAGEGKQPDGV